MGEHNWQTTLAVGRNDHDPGDSSDAFLLESTLTFARKNTWLARFERVDKDEFFSGAHPLAGEEFTIDKLSLGYDSALDAFYGDDPASLMLFLRGRL